MSVSEIKIYNLPEKVVALIVKPNEHLYTSLKNEHPQHITSTIQACIEDELWNVLEALKDQGFDFAPNYKCNLVEETWIHYVLRCCIYQKPHAKMDRLIQLGADPFLCNGQGITPLGLLAFNSKNMPNNEIFATLKVFECYGVFPEGLCEWGTKDIQRYEKESGHVIEGVKEGSLHLLGGKKFSEIIPQDPLILAEVERSQLLRSTPVTQMRKSGLRL